MKLAVFIGASLLLSRSAMGCAPDHARVSDQISAPPTAPSGSASSQVGVSPALTEPAASVPGTTAPDAGAFEILWNWKGTYQFTELPHIPRARCFRYRIVVDKCPGPCTVHVDADSPQTKVRLEGVGRATSNSYQLEVRFTGYRPDDPSKTGIPADSVLLTLEALPGHGMALYFGELPSSDKSDTLFTSHVSLPRAQ
jgi:hypothetical protein